MIINFSTMLRYFVLYFVLYLDENVIESIHDIRKVEGIGML
jgi:hypothetical protein